MSHKTRFLLTDLGAIGVRQKGHADLFLIMSLKQE